MAPKSIKMGLCFSVLMMFFEFLINPITAIGLLEEAKKNQSNTFIQNGASSSVGKLVLYYNKKYKLNSINIIRTEKHRPTLMDLGATVVLNQSDPSYPSELKQNIKQYKPTSAFDCLAGDATSDLFNLLPHYSKQYVYGSLELKGISKINPTELIFTNKELKGFHLVHSFLKGSDLRKYSQEINEVSKEFKQGIGIKVFDLENFKEALEYYPSRHEKVLFKCS